MPSKTDNNVMRRLNDNSRALLERGAMNLAIDHDLDCESAMSVDCIRMALRDRQPVKHLTLNQLFTRYNCAIV
jgi:LacI family transcriptional regulator